MTTALRRTVVLTCLLLPAFVSPAAAGGGDPGAEAELLLERVRLQQALRQARPAPVRPGRIYSAAQTSSAEQRRSVSYDLATGVERVSPAPARDPVRALPPDPPFPGHLQPFAAAAAEYDPAPLKIVPSEPVAVYETHSFPWETIFKLYMRFDVDSQEFWYVCSASAAGDFHLVTAGHCIYNWDPNDDDDESDARWADAVYAFAGQTDMVEPIGVADRPFGQARGVRLRSYTGWSEDHNYGHDWGVVTLDRPIGEHVGWMGRESDETDSLHYSGYPTQEGYVPDNSLVQYHGYDDGNVVQYTEHNIHLDAFIYGGHSGGPAWRDAGGDELFINGINSTSDRQGSATECLLSADKRSDLNAWMAEDEGDLPPAYRPELVEYVRAPEQDLKELHANQVEPGGTVEVTHNVYNAGHAPSGTITIEFYLSQNDLFSRENDTFIDSITEASLDPRDYRQTTTSVTIPASVGEGTYYLFWFMNCANQEYVTDDLAAITDETLTVGGSSCDPPSVPGGVRTNSSSVSSGTGYTISWNPVADAHSYEIQEDTNPSFASPSSFLEDGTSLSFQHTVSSTTTYYYRVRASSSCGASSGWSPEVPVVVTTSSPSGNYRYLVAGVASAQGVGGSSWRTYLSVCNRSGDRANLTLFFRYNTGSVQRTYQLANGDQVAWDNVVSSLFDSGSSSGAVEVSSDREVVVQARTYNDTADGTYGQYLPGVSVAEMIDDRRDGLLGQLRNSWPFRTNVGFVNPGSGPVSVRVRIFSSSGSQAGSTTTTVPAGGWKQINDVFDRAGTSVAQAYAIVEVTSPGGEVWAYASVVDRESGDPTTIPVVILPYGRTAGLRP